jgi:type IV secretory pathway protease TraF
MNRATIVFILAAAVLFWAAALLGHANGFRINHTPSLSVGLWRIAQPHGPIERGQIVSFCPPDTAFFRRALVRGMDRSWPLPRRMGAIAETGHRHPRRPDFAQRNQHHRQRPCGTGQRAYAA